MCDYIFLLIDAIIAKIHEAGFEVAMQKELTLTKEQAIQFYKEHEGKDFFDSLTTHMSRFVYRNDSVNHLYTVALCWPCLYTVALCWPCLYTAALC